MFTTNFRRCRVIGISGSLIWSKTFMKLIFKPCGEFRWNPEGPVSQIQCPHLRVGASGIFSDLLRSVQMLKREWGAESNGKLPQISIPSKTAAWVPEFAVEDLPLSRTATLVPGFAVKDLPLGRILMMMMTNFKYILLLTRCVTCFGLKRQSSDYTKISLRDCKSSSCPIPSPWWSSLLYDLAGGSACRRGQHLLPANRVYSSKLKSH